MRRREVVRAGVLSTLAVSTGVPNIVKGGERNMASGSTVAFQSAVELADEVSRGVVSATELTQYFIDRIEKYDDGINAVVVRDFERAMEAAAALDAQKSSRGPLHGVPVTVKESYNVGGLATTWGNPVWKDFVKAEDAALVAKYKQLGAVVLGKTNVPLMLGDYQSYNGIYGVTNNPWDVSRGPGGSSGGSAAALAAGLTGMEAGSDIGGSLRNPAHYCGVYAHKPTWGIVPMTGHQPPPVPGSNGADIAVVGPMARSANDLRLAMEHLPGPMPLQSGGWRLDLPPARASALKELRVAFWYTEESAPVDNEIIAKAQEVAKLLREAGATVVEDARPEFDLNLAMMTFIYLMQAVNMSGVPDEMYEQNLKIAQQFAKDDFSPEAMFAKSAVQTHNEWVKHDGARHMMRAAWNRFFADIDVLVCPISATTAFKHDHSEPAPARMISVNGKPRAMFEQSFWAGLFGVAGLPSTVFPTGLSDQGLPIGLQAVTAEYNDRTSIEFAAMLEEAMGGFQAPIGYA